MGAGIVFAQIVGVVRCYQRHTHFVRQSIHQRHQTLILLHAMILNFQEEIVFAVDVAILVGQFLTLLILVSQQRFVDVATQAGGHCDEAF